MGKVRYNSNLINLITINLLLLLTGGAGTWSDGKLTTRIGKNSETVRKILEILVENGAPERILVDGNNCFII